MGIAAAALAFVLCIGTAGYVILGFGVLNALYQTVTTVTTVGFREVEPLNASGKVFTIFLIIGGVGTALYTLGAVLEALIEDQLEETLGRRRMERDIDRTTSHTIVSGWGRVGRTITPYSAGLGEHVVVIDTDEERLADCPHPSCSARPPTMRRWNGQASTAAAQGVSRGRCPRYRRS